MENIYTDQIEVMIVLRSIKYQMIGRKLENIDYQSTLGKTPRNFAIDLKEIFY